MLHICLAWSCYYPPAYKSRSLWFRYTNDWYNLLSEDENVIPTMYAFIEETLTEARDAGEKVGTTLNQLITAALICEYFLLAWHSPPCEIWPCWRVTYLYTPHNVRYMMYTTRCTLHTSTTIHKDNTKIQL